MLMLMVRWKINFDTNNKKLIHIFLAVTITMMMSMKMNQKSSNTSNEEEPKNVLTKNLARRWHPTNFLRNPTEQVDMLLDSTKQEQWSTFDEHFEFSKKNMWKCCYFRSVQKLSDFLVGNFSLHSMLRNRLGLSFRFHPLDWRFCLNKSVINRNSIDFEVHLNNF